MQVFVSVGATYSPGQEAFVSAFEVFLSQNGCVRLTVGRGSQGAQQPIFRTDRFKGVFGDFVRIAKERAVADGSQRNARLTSLTVGDLIRDLQPGQLWAMGAAIITMLSAVAIGAFWLGSVLKSG